jgi:hypothetical protein
MAVVPLLQKEPHWRQVYADSGCVLFLAGARESRESPLKKSCAGGIKFERLGR